MVVVIHHVPGLGQPELVSAAEELISLATRTAVVAAQARPGEKLATLADLG